MDMRIIPFLMLVLVPGVLAISVDVQIEEKIDGHMPYLNITSYSPQKYSVSWENVGTYFCRARARIDFYNKTKKVYTSWSSEGIIKPGETVTWHLYSYLEEGMYNYTIRIDHCNEPYDFGPYPLIILNSTPMENVVDIISSSADEDRVKLTLKSNRDLRNLVIIPVEYPANWAFESVIIESMSAGETREVEISYEPINWKNQVINFVAATEDGNYLQRKPIILREQESFPYYSLAIFIIVAIVVIYLYFKKSSFLIWKK